ncbi:hypothetical protein IR148_17050 [Dysgonomonas mossii]|uniref:Uncharacterized protein n=1 Tax=Dysgonomonas mossii TaxID=163665 RepID=A0A4Y9IJR4_9BACT|nr:hypothetical protein [Dysgonomonas mossii]MBF0762743.1 hypothetical protein [Dysgonomonas mossii]TFU86279.1 hypothetical protein E4T88_17040 [Dysgonomonas mossii]
MIETGFRKAGTGITVEKWRATTVVVIRAVITSVACIISCVKCFRMYGKTFILKTARYYR